MNITPARDSRIYIRSRSPKLTLAFWAFALIAWVFSELKGAPAPESDLYYIIVDRSGSMGPGENNLVGPATEKLREFVADLPLSASVRVVFFNTTMGQLGSWNNLTAQTKKEINQWIAAEFRPSGGTRLFDTVGQVLNDVLKDRTHFARIGLLVFSDGEDNASQNYKSWSEIERISSQLVAAHPAAFMRLYSLGREPRTTPGSPWKTEAAPDAADLQKLNLEPSPEARFKIIPDSVQIDKKVVFVVLPGPGRIESASWTFGDGVSANGTTAEHVFTKAGVFNGSLTVNGGSGADTQPFSVTVTDLVPLRAAFTWLPKSARIGDTIEFVDESAGSPSESHWFIDGKHVGSGRTFSWPSDQAGILTAKLEIKRGAGTADVMHTVQVLPPKLDAGFEVSPGHSVSVSTSIVVRALAQAPDITHEWSVAGVVCGDHAEFNWTASQPGLIEITHRIVRGVETADTTDRIQVVTEPPPAEFTVAPGLEIDLGQTITAKSMRSDPVWRHSWRLSSGETFSDAAIMWQPKQLGRVEIVHEVESPSGRAESNKTLIVRDKVSAEFTVSSSAGQTPLEVKFTPLSQTGVVSYLWDFRDGETSPEAKPNHTYRAAGEYSPRLTVRDIAGREHTYQLPKAIRMQAPRPKWIAWAIGMGIVVAVALGGALFARDRRRAVDLSGRLEWRFGTNRGRVELAGRQFDLGTLGIPSWKPRGTYALVHRKATGFQLLRDGQNDQAVEQDICFDAEGVSFRLLP